MNSETIDIIIKCVTGALSGILAILTIFAGIKSGKWKKLFNKETVKTTLINVIMSIMEGVEQFKNFTSEEKKEYVLTKFNQYCIDNGLEYNKALTDENVERLISFSKEVNAKSTTNGQEHRL